MHALVPNPLHSSLIQLARAIFNHDISRLNSEFLTKPQKTKQTRPLLRKCREKRSWQQASDRRLGGELSSRPMAPPNAPWVLVSTLDYDAPAR